MAIATERGPHAERSGVFSSSYSNVFEGAGGQDEEESDCDSGGIDMFGVNNAVRYSNILR